MAVRISSGTLKGMIISTPDGQDTRPTASKVRSAVMNSCGDRIEGGRVLDCFAGSGAMGIEAISWGAKEVFFIENARPAVRAIKNNFQEIIRRSKADSKSRHGEFILLDLDYLHGLRQLSKKENFDLIWLDPPYKFLFEMVYNEEFWNLIFECLEDSGLIAIESCNKGASLLKEVADKSTWELRRQKKYGHSHVTLIGK